MISLQVSWWVSIWHNPLETHDLAFDCVNKPSHHMSNSSIFPSHQQDIHVVYSDPDAVSHRGPPPASLRGYSLPTTGKWTSWHQRTHYLLRPVRSCNRLLVLTERTWTEPPTESLGLSLTDLGFNWLCHGTGFAFQTWNSANWREARFGYIPCFVFPPSIPKIHKFAFLNKNNAYINTRVCVCRHTYVHVVWQKT